MTIIEKLQFQMEKLKYAPDNYRIALYAGPDDIMPDHRQMTVEEFKALLSAVGIKE